MIEKFSYGGGVQSVAVAVLIAQGKSTKPDYVVIADTGRERLTTWDYLDRHTRPLLAQVGLEVHVAPHSLAKRDLFSYQGGILMPMYTTQTPGYVPEAVHGKVSKLRTYCSSEWKQRVIHRYMRSIGVRKYRTWLGFSMDEEKRVKRSKDGVVLPEYYYPLLELGLSRNDCLALIEGAGLPLPRKSTCRGCPHQTNAEWLDTKLNYPVDWLGAIEDEGAMRAHDPHVWMHRSAKPLAEVDFGPQDSADAECSTGICFT